MGDLQKYLKEQLLDPEFRAQFEKTRPECEIQKAILAARLEKNMTQKELAQITGIRQSNISRIEKGDSTPDLTTIERIAKGLGKHLIIQFQDINVGSKETISHEEIMARYGLAEADLDAGDVEIE